MDLLKSNHKKYEKTKKGSNNLDDLYKAINLVGRHKCKYNNEYGIPFFSTIFLMYIKQAD